MSEAPQLKSSEPLIDIGVNLANRAFHDEIPQVLNNALAANVTGCILTGTCVATSEQVVTLCEEYQGQFPDMLYATAGVHPHDAKDFNTETYGQLEALAAHSAVVAIGETGLDFNRNYSPPAVQERVFEAQLELAIGCQLPVFMHERDAHQRQFEILKSYRDQLTNGVIHCFTGDKKALFNYLDMDLHIGITGWVCDERRGAELQRLMGNIPLDRLMLETDAPYLKPRNIIPKSHARNNEPCLLPWVLKGIADHRPENEREIALACRKTTELFFNLNGRP